MPKTTTAVLEIIELTSGEIVLKRAADVGEPLVTIRFSKESTDFLGNMRHLIAKAMIEAGLETLHELREGHELLAEEDDLEEEEIHLLH